MIADPIQVQAMRELIVTLLRAYGVSGDLSGLDNRELKKELENIFWGKSGSHWEPDSKKP